MKIFSLNDLHTVSYIVTDGTVYTDEYNLTLAILNFLYGETNIHYDIQSYVSEKLNQLTELTNAQVTDILAIESYELLGYIDRNQNETENNQHDY